MGEGEAGLLVHHSLDPEQARRPDAGHGHGRGELAPARGGVLLAGPHEALDEPGLACGAVGEVEEPAVREARNQGAGADRLVVLMGHHDENRGRVLRQEPFHPLSR